MDTILESYKGERSAVIQALQDTQKAEGYISQERLRHISKLVDVPYSYVYAIATFYKSFSLNARGKYVLKVCDGTACHLKASEEMVDEIQRHLGIGVGETTKDCLFSLELVNCLGACAMAPVISINDILHGKLSRKKLRELLDDLAASSDKSAETMPSKAAQPLPDVPGVSRQSQASASSAHGILKHVKALLDTLSEKIGHILEGS